MKRIVLAALAAAGVAGMLQARELTPQEALARALGSRPAAAAGINGTAGAVNPQPAFTQLSSEGSPALYVFDRPQGGKGFIVVAADDCAEALLGYADQGEFLAGEMPVQLREWLEGYAAQIEWARSSRPEGSLRLNGSSRSEEADPQGERQPVAPLCHTTWDQTAPYNDMCPLDNGQRSYTGCMATATAQAMKVFNWPVQPEGSVSYRDQTANTTRSMNFADITFDWDNMLNSYVGNNYTQEQADAVALLMKACGYGAHMSYSTQGSGAYLTTATDALKNYFKYSDNAQVIERDYFGLDEWEGYVYRDLQAGSPVIYTGYTPDYMGHAFVVDGYSSDGFFHLNWGWSGAYDGYFKLYALTPEGFGSGGAAGGFNTGQSATFCLQPEGRETLQTIPFSMVQMGGTVLTLKPTSNKNLHVATEVSDDSGNNFLFINMGKKQNIYMGIQFLDTATDSVATTVALGNTTFSPNTGIQAVDLKIPSALPNGTYEVYGVYRPTMFGGWMKTRTSIGYAGYGLLTVSDGQYTVANVTPAVPSAANPQFTNFYVGRNTSLSVELTQGSDDSEWLGNVVVALFTPDGQTQKGQFTSTAAVDILPGETVTAEFNGYFATGANLKSKVTPGDYLMAFFDGTTGQMLGQNSYPVTIAANPGSGVLSCQSFTLQGDNQAADAMNLKFDINVKCTTGYYGDPLTVVIYPEGGTSTYLTQQNTQPVSILKGETQEITLHVPLPMAIPGNTYVAYLFYLKSSLWGGTNFSQLGQGISFTVVDASGITSVAADEDSAADDAFPVYTLDGRLAAPAGTPTSELPTGLYVRNGHKLIVR